MSILPINKAIECRTVDERLTQLNIVFSYTHLRHQLFCSHLPFRVLLPASKKQRHNILRPSYLLQCSTWWLLYELGRSKTAGAVLSAW